MRERKVIMKSYRGERERVRTVGLDWLLGVLLIGWREGGRKPATLVPLAWPALPSFPHSPVP